MMQTLTIAEALAALEAAHQPLEGEEDIPPNTYSGRQIMRALRWGHDRYERQMREWMASGQVKVVRIRKYGLDGRLLNLPAYQFTAPVAVAQGKR